jgi:hypothetical protein
MPVTSAKWKTGRMSAVMAFGGRLVSVTIVEEEERSVVSAF